MKCCGKEITEYTEDFYLLDTKRYSDRHVTVGFCINLKCKAKVAQLLQYDNKIKRYDRVKPPKKDVDKAIKEWKSEPYRDKFDEPKYGSYSDTNWVNGITTKDSEFAVDFNNVQRLVRTTKPKIFREYKNNNLLYLPTDLNGEKTLMKSF